MYCSVLCVSVCCVVLCGVAGYGIVMYSVVVYWRMLQRSDCSVVRCDILYVMIC